MKSLTKTIRRAGLALVLLLTTSFSANAAFLKQDVLLLLGGGLLNIGSIEYEVKNFVIDSGTLLDTAFDDSVFRLREVTFFGNTAFDVFDFGAVIDSDNIGAGLEFLALDAQELTPDAWTYNLIFDAFAPAGAALPGFIDIFNGSQSLVGFFDFTLGSVQVVSAPSSAILLALASTVVLVRVRRKR